MFRKNCSVSSYTQSLVKYIQTNVHAITFSLNCTKTFHFFHSVDVGICCRVSVFLVKLMPA